MKPIYFLTVSILFMLSSCSKCEITCELENSKVDCLCPDVCHNGQTDLLANSLGTTVSLEQSINVDKASASISAATSAYSDAYIYLYNSDSLSVGSFHAVPGNYEMMDSLSIVLDSGFVFPVEVSYYTIYSWWNPANINELSLCATNSEK